MSSTGAFHRTAGSQAAARTGSEVWRGALAVQAFPLDLSLADEEITVRISMVGCNAYRLRCRPQGAGTVVDVFRLMVDPTTGQQVLDPFSGRFYDNIVSFGAAGTTTQFGANGTSFALFNTVAMMGTFDLLFYTGLGGYNSTGFLEGYHQQGVAA